MSHYQEVSPQLEQQEQLPIFPSGRETVEGTGTRLQTDEAETHVHKGHGMLSVTGNANTSSASTESCGESVPDRVSKKSAQLGQWRTPPQPFFPSVAPIPTATTSSATQPGQVTTVTPFGVAVQHSGMPSTAHNLGSASPTAMAIETHPILSSMTAGQGDEVATATRANSAPSVSQMTTIAGGNEVARSGNAASSTIARTTVPRASSADNVMQDLQDFDLASLQEAYRRGMAAAAALSQHQLATGENVFADLAPSDAPPRRHPTATTAAATSAVGSSSASTGNNTVEQPASTPSVVASSASCPNFQDWNRQQQQLLDQHQQQQQQQQQYQQTNVSNSHVTIMPQHQQQQHKTKMQLTPATTAVNSQMSEELDPQLVSQQHDAHKETQGSVFHQQPYEMSGMSPPPTPTPMHPNMHPNMHLQQQQQQQQLHSQPHPFMPQLNSSTTGANTGVASPAKSYISSSSPSSAAAAAAAAASARSVSLPDMQLYAGNANQEDEKRKKRLARNRASARLRRLRKKNLVESYEGEVGVLESSLSKLRAHKWGVSNDHEALLEALSMERGQQNLSAEARKQWIKDILTQQREQVANLMEAQLESMVVGWLVRRNEESCAGKQLHQQSQPDAMSDSTGNINKDQQVVESDNQTLTEEKSRESEDEELAKELNDVLQLTPEQETQLKKLTDGVEEERKAIRTVDMCLDAMMTNGWLANQETEECVDHFMSMLNPGQMSKFLLWTDHNSEAIDQLDYVNAPPASAPPSSAPTFVFGTDDCGHDDGAGDDIRGH